MSFPLSKGYLLVDSEICQGCQSCMMACSMVHEGESNLSLSRIQVMQNILENWPDDIRIVPCQQCANPLCVKACPTGALHVDTATGVRVVDEAKCEGHKLCIEACPYMAHRIIWKHEMSKASKCDLCVNTPYWDETGGPDGKQICVEICPVNAIKFIPTHWAILNKSNAAKATVLEGGT